MKTALMMFVGTSTVDPYWAGKFWAHVLKMEQCGEIGEPVIQLLKGHGYVGEGTVSAPRVAELAKGLEAVDQSAPPALGGVAGDPLGPGGLVAAAGGSQETRWGLRCRPTRRGRRRRSTDR